MKKYIILLLSLLLVLQAFTVSAATTKNQYDLLDNLGFIPAGFEDKNLNDLATRDDLAAMTAKLMNLKDLAPTETAFTDVGADNLQSGYIKMLNEAGIVNGVSETEFAPKGSVSMTTAATMVFRVLGYEGLVAKDSDYGTLAYSLKLHKDVALNEKGQLTNAGLLQFFQNVLEMELPYDVFSYTADGKPLYDDGEDESVLGALLDISAYEGVVTAVHDAKCSVTVKVESNRKSNPVQRQEGSSYTFTVDNGINVNNYLHVPCVFWVDDNDHIVAIEPEKNVEVICAYVYSVNGDYDAQHTYSGAYIKEIMLNDNDEIYDVHQDFKLYYNFAQTEQAVEIIGNFARIVLKDDEVIVMELWDLEEGGLITEVDGADITYTSGTRQNINLKDFGDVQKRLIFIDGVSSDIKDLRNDSVFYYYKDDENFVVVASEKKVTDVLHSVSATQLQIGNILYNAGDVYYSTDGKNFNEKGMPESLLGQTVDAYFTAGAKCLYVMPVDPDSVKTNTYIGLITGSKEKIFGAVDVQILFLEPAIETKVYPLSEKLLQEPSLYVEEGLDLDVILSTVNTKDGELILEYEIRNDEIVGIKTPLRYAGYRDEIRFNGFPNNGGRPMIVTTGNYTNSGGNQVVYFFDTPLTFLYEKDGKLNARVVPWSKIYNSNSGLERVICLQAFGYENNSDMRLALFCGNTEMVSSEVSKNFGLVIGKSSAVDAEGNVCTSLEVLDNNGTKNYILPNEEARTIPEKAYIEYFTGGILKDENEITVLSSVDLSGSVEDMEAAGLAIGTVARADDKRLVFEDGKAFFYDPVKTCVFYKRMQDSRGTRFEAIDKTELAPGDSVAYYNSSNGLLCIIALS